MKLNYKQTILIGLAFSSILAFWQFYDQVIPYLLESVFGLSVFQTNLIMSIDNVLAIFMLPLFGMISDKTKTPLGKRTPYILIGTILAVVLLILLCLFESIRSFPWFLTCLILLLIVMATYRTPAVAYMPDVTEKPLRSKGNAIINLVGYVGGIFATVAMMVLLSSSKDENGSTVYSDTQSFFPIFIVIAGYMLSTVLILVFTLHENRLHHVTDSEEEENIQDKSGMSPDKKKSLLLVLLSVFLWFTAYNAVTTAFSRYCVSVWGVSLGTSSGYLLVATVSAIISFVPLGIISGKIGRKNTVLMGITLMSVSYGIAILIHSQTPIMYLIFAVVGIGWAAINVNSFPMVVDMCSGDDVGRYTGFYYTFSMAAQIFTPLLSGFLITKCQAGYRILFPYALVFSVLSFLTMLGVKHGDSKPQKSASVLEQFDNDL